MNTNKKNILIVDDVADNLTVLSELLIAEGYLVRPVTSGAAALKTITTGIPDLILLDIKMPEMDGFQVCRRIKVDEKLKDIPIIFISAYGEEAEKVKAFEAGGVDYIIKPFHAGEIYARVKAHLTLAENKKTLEQMNYNLEKMVLMRTKELEESNLRLKKSQETFFKVFQFNPVIMVISSLNDRVVVEVNKTFEIRTGHSRAESIGKPAKALNITSDPVQWDLLYELALNKGHYNNQEVELLTKSGDRKTGLFSCEIIEFNGEQCILTAAEDITERKQSENKIKEQLQELQRWYSLNMNREDRVSELKKEVNRLLARLNEPPRYNSSGG